MATDTAYLNNHHIQIISDDDTHKVLDIQIKFTGAQRNKFLSHFAQTHLDWRTAACTSIVQNELAKYTAPLPPTIKDKQAKEILDFLRNCSAIFPDLEAMINDPPLDGNLENLKKAVKNWHAQIHQKIVELEDDFFPKKFDNLKENLNKNVTEFFAQITAIESEIKTGGSSTGSKLRKLFSVQNEIGIFSLGGFIAKQHSILLNEGIKQAKQITDSNISLHPAVKVISNARAMLERKHQSLHGTRYNNSRTPNPQQNIDLMRSYPEDAPAKWMSIKPYVADINQLQSLDKILCHLEDRVESIPTASWLIMLPVSAIEFALSLLRLPISFFSFLRGFFPNSKNSFITGIENWAGDMHQQYSLITYTKINLTKGFIANVERRSPGRYIILDKIKGDPENLYCELMTKYLSGHKIAESVKESLYNIGYAFVNFFREFVYHSSVKKRQGAVNKIQEDLEKKREEILSELSKENKANIAAKRSTIPREEKDTREDKAAPTAEIKTVQMWDSPTPWPENEFVSVLDFGDEIFTELSNFIDFTFRNSPDKATGCFIFVNATWILLAHPALAAKLGYTGKAMVAVPTYLAKAFTGREISNGFLPQMFSIFLEWKIGYLTAELAPEIACEFLSKLSSAIPPGDFEYIRELLPETEKITIATLVLVTSGIMLGYLPELDLPAQYLPLVPIYNGIVTESQHCSHGTFPFNSLEYLFLGLKGSLLVKALLSGRHQPEIIALDINALVTSLKKIELDVPQSVLEQRIIEVLLSFNINSKELDTHAPGFTGAILRRLLNQGLEQEKDIRTCYVQEKKPGPEDKELIRAWAKLSKLISITGQMENLRQTFRSSNDAKYFYDELHFAFDNYLKKAGNPLDFQLHKEKFLDQFYNKYCYQGTSSFIKILSIFPGYPATLLWRLVKYILATREGRESPAVIRQIKKSFSKEAAMVLQFLAFSSRVLRAAARAISYVIRVAWVIAATAVATVCTLGVVLFKKSWRDAILDSARYIRLHKTELNAPLKPLYAELTRNAGIASHGLKEQSTVILAQLLQKLPSGVTKQKMPINPSERTTSPPVEKKSDQAPPDITKHGIFISPANEPKRQPDDEQPKIVLSI